MVCLERKVDKNNKVKLLLKKLKAKFWKGDDGIQGEKGNKGFNAKKGSKGIFGEIGENGQNGLKGTIGLNGLNGDLGNQGKEYIYHLWKKALFLYVLFFISKIK